MTDVRQMIRDHVPFSGPAYERGEHLWRLRSGRKRAQELLDSGRELRIDIGGGARAGSGGWLTLDVTRECDIYWDLRKGIPFPDASVTQLYSSHLFEHLTFQQGQELFVECLRVLKPGGSMSICVPNARLYLAAYVEGRDLPGEWFGWRAGYNESTRIDMVNYIAYLDGHHQYMFDEENLVERMRQAGFQGARIRDFNPEMDFVERDYESIYAIGYRA